MLEGLKKGQKIALQADTGKWFSRCHNCQQTVGNNPDTITVHVDSPVSSVPSAQFEVIDMGNGKIALKANTGKYVARCRGCVVNGAYPDFVTVHVDNPSAAYAQFTPERLANGKYALKADTGKYVARCRGCSPTSAYPDTVTIHVDDPKNAPYAQWNIVYLPLPEQKKEEKIPIPKPTTTPTQAENQTVSQSTTTPTQAENQTVSQSTTTPTQAENQTVSKPTTAPKKVTEKPQKVGLAQFLSLAPILLMILLTFTAGLLIEFNRFYPDLLFHPLG